ncbi:hypothetical protein Q4493_07335 [Colwellia sp. 1_MG-2023]|uniref:DUF6942 family protein n=1 Tax=Colwellia sp. 1_MG-2023 TaxID=3062649 RepID=UPI0026E2D4BB|nr:hypothetical protein [Colwellia sp. 1_MG-2023]MDO6445585.1 hypothetical protein [Colwellia sp. 1_MG-2023]
MTFKGLGKPTAQLNVFIENTPPLTEYQTLQACRPMQVGEIKTIADLTGNHWRKIFNVYAKLAFELTPTKYKTWQDFRDCALLQNHSNENLLFNLTPQEILQHVSNKPLLSDNISIIMGKTYATKLGFSETCHWLSAEFAVNADKKLVICPYFDYRQLSNIKITQLCQLINALHNK